MRHPRRLGITTIGLIAVTVLLGCGGETNTSDDSSGGDTAEDGATAMADLSGREIVTQAQEALQSVSSLHLQIDITTADGDLTADFALDRDRACAGTLGYRGMGSFEIIKIEDDVWLQPDQAFWESQLPPEEAEAASALLVDRYLTGPPDHEMIGSLAEICDLDELLDDQAEFGDSEMEYSKGETTTVDGREAVAVHWTDDAKDFTLYVDTGGEFYPVRLVNDGDDEPGSMSFSAFDEPVEPTPPAADDVLDVSVLEDL